MYQCCVDGMNFEDFFEGNIMLTFIKLIKYCGDSRILTIFCIQFTWSSNVGSNFCIESWEYTMHKKAVIFKLTKWYTVDLYINLTKVSLNMEVSAPDI